MPEQPKYAENIIVGVIADNQWKWYISDKYYWVMDVARYINDIESEEPDEDLEVRFNIPVVDQNTMSEFLNHMKRLQVDVAHLRAILEQAKPTTLDDTLEYIPSLLVDFNNQELWSMYPESDVFEYYVPNNWRGVDNPFWTKIPKEERYWIINGKNYFAPYGVA
jgi:hypothetical protein